MDADGASSDRASSDSDAHTRRTDTTDPRRSRARALAILFQADVRGERPTAALARVDGDPSATTVLDDPDAAWGGDAPADPGPDSSADPDQGAPAEARPDRPAAPLDDFTRSLVRGVDDTRTDLDAMIERFARRWTVSRMPVIDRNVLRLATFELIHEQTSPAIVISEALELAKSLSTDNSGRYVNGVLESIRRHLEDDPA